MPKMYVFMAVMSVDQNEQSGDITMDHHSRKLGNVTFLSNTFDLRVSSPLKDALNAARTDLFQSVVDEHNDPLPDSVSKRYIIDRTRMIPSLAFLKGQIVVPVEITLEFDDSVDLNPNEKGYIASLTSGKVVKIETLGSRMCNHPKPYSAWKSCEYGQKKSFFRKIETFKQRARRPHPPKTAMSDAFQKAGNE